MQRYDSYKDSGIQWLGEIPSHWEVKRLRSICKMFGRIGFRGYSKDDLVEEGDDGAITLSPTNFIDGKLDFTKCSYLSWQKYYESPEIMVHNGDIVFVKTASIGKCAVALNLPKETTINPQIIVFKEINCNPIFLNYFLQNRSVQGWITATANGSTISTISQSTIGDYPIVLPPLSEQQAIATYLDEATAKIDEAIAQQQKMIDLLNERKQIIINNAVTKGLNPNAKMKPSGIDWIGNIPEHWEVRKLKQIAKLRSGDTISSDQFTTSGFPVFGGNGFRGYTDRYTNEGNYVLIGRQGALCGNVNYADGKFFATEHAVVVYPHSSENVIWLGECIKASNLNQYSQSAAQPGLAVSVIGNVSYPYPPTEERDSIAEYIRQNTERLDCSINNATKQIALLQERKQIIINDVVTGKVKVV